MDDPTAPIEIQGILHTIRTIMETGTDPARWPPALDLVRDGIGAASLKIIAHDFLRRQGSFEIPPSPAGRHEIPYGERFADANPLLATEQNFQSPGQVWYRHELIGDREFFASDFYNQYLQPQDLHHCLVATLWRAGSRVQIALAARPQTEPPFGQAEHDLLGLLAPYLGQSLTVNTLLGDGRRLNSALQTALDHMRYGTLIVSLDDRFIRMANQVAQEHLGAADGLFVENGGLRLGHGPAGQEFDEIIAQITAGDLSGGDIVIRRKSSATPLYLLVLPLEDPGPIQSVTDRQVLVLLVDPDQARHIDPQRLRKTYELTRAEARLTARLVAGLTLGDAAADLGITYNTARTHLKQIMAKTETERQADLIRVVLSGPAQLMPGAPDGTPKGRR